MTEITQTRQLSPLTESTPTPPRRSARILLAAAAAVLVLAGLIAVVIPTNDTTNVNEVVESTDAVVTMLDPLVDGQEGMLQIVWSNDRDQVAVVGSGLADPGPDNAYALWFLLDDGVAPAGLFRPLDGSVSVVIDIDDIATTGWGISIEPATGSEQPTTDVLFAGTF